jgi:hypothetical protein
MLKNITAKIVVDLVSNLFVRTQYLKLSSSPTGWAIINIPMRFLNLLLTYEKKDLVGGTI